MESGLTLDLNRLLRQRNIVAGKHLAGSLTWSNTQTGERTAALGYEAALVDPDAAWIRLFYSVNGTQKDYQVRLATTSCHYGGHRWWFVCPVSGRRAAKLYLPPGATVFAARSVYRLAYRSQRVGVLERSHARQAKLYRKLGEDYDQFEQPLPARPKGMHATGIAKLTASGVRSWGGRG